MKGAARILSIGSAVSATIVVIVVGALTFNDAGTAQLPDLPSEAAPPSLATGPLRIGPTHARYFIDAGQKAVYLTGAHTWNSLQDIGYTDAPPAWFDFEEYLRFLEEHRHNFVRLWRQETARFGEQNTDRLLYSDPHPWPRSGARNALDGTPQFDLSKVDPRYFERLRSRVRAAGSRGIYVSIMLFEGWAMRFAPRAWEGHPFNRANNINGIDCDLNRDGKGLECFTLAVPAVVRIQESYVRNVIDAVNDLDNVLYEISNENHWDSFQWELHFVDYVRRYQKGKPKQHPVGLTSNGGGGQDDTARLLASPADWISPNSLSRDYRNNPPAASGRAVVITDTDHLWGLGGDRTWVWKSFTRGLNPIFMDPYKEQIYKLENDTERQRWESLRRAMGHAAAFASRLDLNRLTPRSDLASSGYCLANPGTEYLVYLPFERHPIESARFAEPIRILRAQFARDVTVDLSAGRGAFIVEWFDPSSGRTMPGESVMGGERRSFTAPFTGDAVLHLRIAQ